MALAFALVVVGASWLLSGLGGGRGGGVWAIEPEPRAADVVTIVNRDSPLDVRLDANLAIPDGGELLLGLEVPRETITIDAGGPAKVTRVYSDHAAGAAGVGEAIDVFVEFTSPVDVVGNGGAMSLELATGCHASGCHTREVQRLRCQATAGKFSVGFDGQRVVNIPYDASPTTFADYLTRMTKIDRVLIDYHQADGTACTYLGNNITITFESMNVDGLDGDLPELVADPLNAGGDGSALGHVRLDVILTTRTEELQKGRRVPNRRAAFMAMADPRTLRFRYVVQPGDTSSRLDYASSDALGQSIRGANGAVTVVNANSIVAADTKLPPPGSPGDWERGLGSSLAANRALVVDVTPPFVTSITSPHVDGTFGIGEEIPVHVSFSHPVVVTGQPTLVLETGQVDRIIPFRQLLPVAAGTTVLEFLYIVQSKDTSPDLTYTGPTALVLNGGTIKRVSTTPTTDAVLTLPANGGKGSLSVNKNIVIDTTNPKVVAVTAATPNGVYTAGDTIEINVRFDTPVVVTGTPQLLLSTGSVDLYPGAVVDMAPTASSPKTIVFPAVDHGLSTETSRGLQFLIDGQVLTVDAVNGDAVTMLETYTGTVVDPLATTPASVPIKTPGYRPARYVRGSETLTLVFAYQVQRGDTSLDLDYTSTSALQLNAGTIKRLSTTPATDADLTLASPGATGSLGQNAAIVIDSARPQIVQANALTRDGVYRAGDQILFELVFTLPVVVDPIASVRLNIVAPRERWATYARGSDTTSVVFQLTVLPDDSVPSLDFMDTNSLRAAFGSVFGIIRRRAAVPTLPAVLTLPATGLSSKGIAIDQACVHVLDVTSDHEDGVVAAGEQLNVQVQYSAAVDVDVTMGRPTLTMSTKKTASYQSGSGTTTLTFQYIVAPDDSVGRLTYDDIYALSLRGGTIFATGTTTPASTVLPPPPASALGTTRRLNVDTTAPVVLEVTTRSLDGVYTVGDRLVVSVRWNAPVEIAPVASNRGTPMLLLHLGQGGNGVPALVVSTDEDTIHFDFTIATGKSTSRLAYVSRTALKCVGGFGLNKDGAQGSASQVHAVEYQNRLMVVWSELQSAGGSIAQLRAKSVDVTRGFPALWAPEDGDGVTGLVQFDPGMDAVAPMLVVVQTRLYAVWQEKSATTNNPTQVRVASYLGGDPTVTRRWAFVDKSPASALGINRDPTQSAAAPHGVVHANALYVAWHEGIAGSTATQIRVAAYNGQDGTPSWTFVDGNAPTRGLNFAPSRGARNVRLVSCGGSLFAAWEEAATTTGVSQIRVAVMSLVNAVATWRFVDGNSVLGVNADTTRDAASPSPACFGGTVLMLAWQEATTVNGGATTTRIRAKQFDTTTSSTWRSADGSRGLNADITQSAVQVRLRASPAGGALYATWSETEAASGKAQVRVAAFSALGGGAWTLVDGGDKLSSVNVEPTQDATRPVLVVSTLAPTSVYVLWQETHAATGTTHVRASRTDLTAEPLWLTMLPTCIRARSTTSVAPASVVLPQINAPGSLDFGRAVRVDTSTPTVSAIEFYGEATVIASANSVQTLDVFNTGSLQQGQFKLTYGGRTSACIHWNASPSTGAGSIKAAIQGIPGLALQADVTQDPGAFQDGARYTITFTYPVTGLQPLRLADDAEGCAAWVCGAAARLVCNAKTLVQVNQNTDVPMRGGVVDVTARFTAPVVVQAGNTPQLLLETGAVDRSAVYTTRGVRRAFDVGTQSPSRVLRGGFKLAYGDKAAGVNAMTTTDCIDVAFVSDEDAVEDLRTKLLALPELQTIGIKAVSRFPVGNGHRYEVLFRNSADLLDLIPVDASACAAYAGRVQTIDIHASSAIVAGEYQIQYGDQTSACVPVALRAKGPAPSLESVLSGILPDRIVPLQVAKDTSAFAHGVRYDVRFMRQTDAEMPLSVSVGGACAAIVCDDGNGGQGPCADLSVGTNGEFTAIEAASDVLSFRYVIQATDKAATLAVHDRSALSGNIIRASMDPTLVAMLTIPSTVPAAPIRVLSLAEIPTVVRVFSSTRDDTYTAGDVLVLYVQFSAAVDVVGRPMLELNSGGVGIFYAGSGTETLEFRYKVGLGEAAGDLNYASTYALRTPGRFTAIVASSPGSSDTPPSSAAIDADVTLPGLASATSLGSLHALVVSTAPPTIVSVSSTRADTPNGGTGYGVGDIVDIVVEFSAEVAVEGQPSLPLTSGAAAVFTYAGYRQLLDIGVHAMYPITSGEFAVSYKGRTSGCVDFGDPSSPAASSLRSRLLEFEELVAIGIQSITMTTKKNGHRFVIVFDDTRVLEVPESVLPVVSDVCAPLLPSSSDSTPGRLVERATDTLVRFHYDIGEGDVTADLDYTSTTIALVAPQAVRRRARAPVLDADPSLPAPGSPNSLSGQKTLKVDGTPVTIVDVIADSAGGTYGVAFPADPSPATVFPGEILFHLVFSRAVKVTGSPTLELATGSLQPNGQFLPNRRARFVNQPQPTQAAFLYRVQEGDWSPNLAFASLHVLDGATIYCVSTSSKFMARTLLPRLLVSGTSTITIDAVSVPTTVKLSSTHVDGTWGAGEAIEIQVTFSKSVVLQTGLNRNQNAHAQYPVALEFRGNVFVLWTEWSTPQRTPTTTSFLYLRVFASDTLAEVPLLAGVQAPINRLPHTFIERVSATVWQDQLFAAWDEDGLLYCARFNGLDAGASPWTVIPNMGANRNIQRRASSPVLLVHGLALMMVWREEAAIVNGAQQPSVVGQIRVAQRNDDLDAPLWIFHDGNDPIAGLNRDLHSDAREPSAVVFRGAMYVAWSEYDPAVGAYAVVVARRYIQNRDRSVWQFLTHATDSVSASADVFVSAYRPAFGVRRRGIEDLSLWLTWDRDTKTANVSEVVVADVAETVWSERDSRTSIAFQLAQRSSSSSPTTTAATTFVETPNARGLRTWPCGDTLFASWAEGFRNAHGAQVQGLHLARLDVGAAATTGWRPVFQDAASVANHNPAFDAGDPALVCSQPTMTTSSMGMFWTEYDGISMKLRFRHERIPQRLGTEAAVTWGETSTGAPLLKLDTATAPVGAAYGIDRSGQEGYVLTFLYVVQPGHTSPRLDVLDRHAFVLNGARVLDYLDQTPDFSLFPRSQDLRALSFNNALKIDTTAPGVVDVSSTTPSGEYGVGERIRILVTFDAPVVVTLDPASAPPSLYLRSDELHLHDYMDDPAVYVSGSGSPVLAFEYVTTELDYSEHLEYMRSDSLVANGRNTIRRNATFPITDARLTLPSPRALHSLGANRVIAIKPTPPRVLDVTSTALNGRYFPGDVLPITVTFSLPVSVFGTPALALATGPVVSARANYVGGNGTTVLTFEYAVDVDQTSEDLEVVDDRQGNTVLNYVLSLLLLRQARIQRAATYPTTDAVLALPAPGFPGSLSRNKALVIDSRRPRVVDVRAGTPDGTYDVGQELAILVEFSHRVVVRGVPYVVLNIPYGDDEPPRTAAYRGGSGSAVLTFVYTVIEGDNTGPVALDTLDEHALVLRPLQQGREWLLPAAEILGQAQRPFVPVNRTMPRPGVPLRADAVRSLVGNNHKLFLRTDGHRVESVTADLPGGETYAPGQRVVLTVAFTKTVLVQGIPRLDLNANPGASTAAYTQGSGTTRLSFEYVVATGDAVNALDVASTGALRLVPGSLITDPTGLYVPLRLPAPGARGSVSAVKQIAIASSAPTVARIYAGNADGAYGVGDDLQIVVEFTRRVALGSTAPGALPSLVLAFQNGVRSAVYASGDQSRSLVFKWRVAAGDDTNGGPLDVASVNALVAPAPGLFALATTPTTPVTTLLPAPGTPGSLGRTSSIVVVSRPPTIVGVTALSRNGTYGLGDRVQLLVQFSYRVVVPGASQSACTLELFLGGGRTALATLSGGSTTVTLVFEYRIGPGDRSGRLDYKTTASLACVVLQFSQNPTLAADVTLPPPGARGSLSASSEIRVDATAPRVLSVSSPLGNGVYGVGQDIDIAVSFSEPVTIVPGDPGRCVLVLRLSIGSVRARGGPITARFVGGVGTSTLGFRYTTVDGDMALPLAYDGIDALAFAAVPLSSPSPSPSCRVVAVAATDRVAGLRLPVPGGTGSLSNNKDLRIDTAEPPRVLRVYSPQPDGTYTVGDTLRLRVVFSAPVAVVIGPNNGPPPSLRLDVGSAEGPVAALYVGGSGTAELEFTYAIAPGDHSDRLEYVRCPDASRRRPRRREWAKLVNCEAPHNALQLGGDGNAIRRQATTPTTPAVLDLPEVSRWPRLRVATSRPGEFVYVDQLDDLTDLTPGDRAAAAFTAPMNEAAMSAQRTSRFIYANGIPPRPSGLYNATEQRYFLELRRFPRREPTPLSLAGFDGLLGVFSDGLPFKAPPPTAAAQAPPPADECGGAVDAQGRYVYVTTPTCLVRDLALATTVDPTPSRPFLALGYAFDGVPVYYYYDERGELPSLDACHGTFGPTGEYRYHLVPPSSAGPSVSPFMPCLAGIDDPLGTQDPGLVRVFRLPVDVGAVEGLPPLALVSRLDGLVVDENPATVRGTSLWLNPTGVSVTYTATTVLVRSNGLPDGALGPFPNAYNPHTPLSQDYVFQLPRQPTVAPTPTPLPPDTPIGVMLNGVPWFASQSLLYQGDVLLKKSTWLDRCNGLVDSGGNYRYYGSPDCLLRELGATDAPGRPSPLIGYALDGFPLYGPYGENGALPTDLDACNGRVGDDGTYRYHVTPGRAPYLIGCFRGRPLLGQSSDDAYRSLSYATALRIDTRVPTITHVFTNKRPGTYVLGETLDVVTRWSVPVVVDATAGPPTLAIAAPTLTTSAGMNAPVLPPAVAVYDPTRSSATLVVFVLSITPAMVAANAAAAGDAMAFDFDYRTSIQLPGPGTTIRRLAATPTLDADLRLVTAERTSRFASKHQLIRDVRVTLRGLYHPHAADLRVRLFHDDQSALVVDGCCGAMAFGRPDPYRRVNAAQLEVFDQNPTSGVGWDYGFGDLSPSAINLAALSGATAQQSSTSGGNVASLALDGRVRGRVSTQDVAQTGARVGALAWWELRLLEPVEVGAVRLWPPLPEDEPAVVVVLTSTPPVANAIPVTGDFTLRLTAVDGRTYETAPIHWNAVARVADEDPRIATPGLGKGESLEAKLLGAIPVTNPRGQRLFVTRSPATELASPDGGFTWSITFLGDPGPQPLGGDSDDDTRGESPLPLPLAIASNDLCDGLGRLTLSRPLPGDALGDGDGGRWRYRRVDGRPEDSSVGHLSMFPLWVLLFEATAVMDFETLEAARGAATWATRVDERRNTSRVLTITPPAGLVPTQFVRVVAEKPGAALALAEVEVFRERSHVLSQYPGGAPVTPRFHPGDETWSPEDSFRGAFAGLPGEGTWTLSVQDLVRAGTVGDPPGHGAGALSDWVLELTTWAGQTRRYFMDVTARVQTLPRHGRLFVGLEELEAEHLDRDRNGVLDPGEAATYLGRFSLAFDELPIATRERVLVDFWGAYAAHGGIPILPEPSGRQKDLDTFCDRRCLTELYGLDPFFFVGTTGDVGQRMLGITGDRRVRYVPNAGFEGRDAFTFVIALGPRESAVLGTVEIEVKACQDPQCLMDWPFVHRTRGLTS